MFLCRLTNPQGLNAPKFISKYVEILYGSFLYIWLYLNVASIIPYIYYPNLYPKQLNQAPPCPKGAASVECRLRCSLFSYCTVFVYLSGCQDVTKFTNLLHLLLILLNHLLPLHLSYCLLWNLFIKFTLWWPKFLQHENRMQLPYTASSSSSFSSNTYFIFAYFRHNIAL